MRSEYIPAERLRRIRANLPPQDMLILDFAVETGYRIDDILHMRVWQIDFEKKEVTLVERKTGKERTVQIGDDLRDRLYTRCRNWHQFRYVFRGRKRRGNRRKFHRATFWRHMERACKELRYPETYTPHSLRKVYAVNLLHKTRSLLAVQRDMGHKHLSTTMLYALSDRRDELGLY